MNRVEAMLRPNLDVRFRVSGKVEICPKAWLGHMVNARFLA